MKKSDLLRQLYELAVIGRLAFLSGKVKRQGEVLCAFAMITDLLEAEGVEPIDSFLYEERASLEAHQELVREAWLNNQSIEEEVMKYDVCCDDCGGDGFDGKDNNYKCAI